jgi:hypothetical protein
MRSHLAKASDKYTLEPKKGIHPIDDMDAKIIDRLSEILTMMGDQDDLLDIIGKWKKVPDEYILRELWKLEPEGQYNYYVKIGEHELPARSIFSIRKVTSYDEGKQKPVHKILLNETENMNMVNGNKEAVFDDWADRDIFLEELREKLSDNTNIKFI